MTRNKGRGRSRAAAALLGLAAAAVAGTAALAQAQLDDLPNPPELRSSGGRLEVTLTAAPGEVTVAGVTFTANVYNGLYIPPTLRILPGDVLDVRLINRIRAADVEIDRGNPTNIHYHGADVSPLPPGDSVFIDVPRGDRFNYVVRFPRSHPLGLHWYHPHVHHFVEPQILSGMSGMFVVDGYLERHYPAMAPLRQRVMVLKDFYLPGQNQNAPKIKTVNGLLNPLIQARPGEHQVWMLGNIGADGYFRLALDGHAFWLIERDGSVLTEPRRVESLLLEPGARATVVVPAGRPGAYPLRSLAVDTGPQGDPNPAVVIGTVVVSGDFVEQPRVREALREPASNLAAIDPRPETIRALPITNRRRIKFSENPNGNKFFVNDRSYKEDRVDTTVPLGAVEEWTIRNTSGELHVFHIHQTSFLVKSVNGVPVDVGPIRDVVNLPYARNGVPGEVKIVIPFTDPRMVGRFVYHCHIVGHEDAGMMANLEVVTRRTAAEELWDRARRLAGLALPALGLGPEAPDLAGLPAVDGVPTGFGGDICRTPPPAPPTVGDGAGFQVSGLPDLSPVAAASAN